ncbi:MAG: anaerobic ribonucleoside triphosphate reductase, partial [Nitrososphaerota archaeon]|nr:anaerobic ribonucleoside triphosphate reductase [Nitrososphaerota archaeon]
MITWVKKRDGRLERFDKRRIEDAIRKAFIAVGSRPGREPERLANSVVSDISKKNEPVEPSVEEIQDAV